MPTTSVLALIFFILVSLVGNNLRHYALVYGYRFAELFCNGSGIGSSWNTVYKDFIRLGVQ